MNTISRIIFNIVAIIKKYKGLVESPRPLKIAQIELYPVENNVPVNIMIRYPLERSKISLGVFIISRILPLKNTPI